MDARERMDTTDRRLVLSEILELSAQVGDTPSEEDKARVRALLEKLATDRTRPLERHLTEAYQLVDSAENAERPLSPQDRALLVTDLVAAGDNKIALFAAWRRIGR